MARCNLCGPGHATSDCQVPIHWGIRPESLPKLATSPAELAALKADIRAKLHQLKRNGILRSYVQELRILYVPYSPPVGCCLVKAS
jgi:hypothetical protein